MQTLSLIILVAIIILVGLAIGTGVIVAFVRRSNRKQQTSGAAHSFESSAPSPAQPAPPPSPAASPTQPAIFLSYRRSDSADATGRIYDRLAAHYGRDAIFKDVDNIPFGVDFRQHIGAEVGRCNIFLAVIGRTWTSASDEQGRRRLDDQSDFVRIEVEAALERSIPVVPLLVSGASMPRDEELPAGIQPLVYRNGTPIRPDPDFHKDMDRLIAGLDQMFS